MSDQDQQEEELQATALDQKEEDDLELLAAGRDYDEGILNTFEKQQRSVMSTMSRVSASVINREDPHI